MANQSHWDKVAQNEVASGKQMQSTSNMNHQDKDRYLAARKMAEQKK